MIEDEETYEAMKSLQKEIRAVSLRVEALEIGSTEGVAASVRMLEFLKDRSPGWASNAELRTLVGNRYVDARGALIALGLVETQRRTNESTDGRGAVRILTRYQEGGTAGRVTKRKILDALAFGPDVDPGEID